METDEASFSKAIFDHVRDIALATAAAIVVL
jgi:hypothetical protein